MPRAPSFKPKKKTALKPLDKSAQKQSSLAQELREEELRNKYGRVSAPGRREAKKSHKDDDDEVVDEPSGRVTGAQVHGSAANNNFVDPKLSRNILRLAQEQQAEIEAEDEADRLGIDARMHQRQQEDEQDGRTVRYGRQVQLADDADISSDEGELNEDEAGSGEDEDLEDTYRQLELDPHQRELIEGLEGPVGEHKRDRAGVKLGGEFAELANALPDGDNDQPAEGGRTLADIIMAKLHESEASKTSGGGQKPEKSLPPGITPKVVEVYERVGLLLSRYRSGPLPKPLKIIPTLPAWETILYITNPASWTPHATLAVTRVMVSNLKAYQTQRYFELVLLDKVRDEIEDTGKLSVQTYDAIKKALYKPSAFFKGFLFPMVENGTVTLKEAAIISSVLQKVSVPMLHSAAALLHLATMPYKGPTSLFIRVLLDKKYALPYKVVDALVFHFLKFSDPKLGVEPVKIDGEFTGERRMPVLWHQSLLVFVQRYKQDLTPDQKTALTDLLRVQYHEGISPEVRRELINSTARGELLDEPLGGGDAWSDDDDAMSV